MDTMATPSRYILIKPFRWASRKKAAAALSVMGFYGIRYRLKKEIVAAPLVYRETEKGSLLRFIREQRKRAIRLYSSRKESSKIYTGGFRSFKTYPFIDKVSL